MSDHSDEAGFSLIELMIAVAVAAIIAAFAIPAYRDHTLRSFTAEATSGLVLSALRLEQYYQDHRSYANGKACGIALPPDGRFHFSCELSADGQAFLLSAGGRDKDAMAEFKYTLDQQGRQRTTALPKRWASAPLDCWITRRGQTC